MEWPAIYLMIGWGSRKWNMVKLRRKIWKWIRWKVKYSNLHCENKVVLFGTLNGRAMGEIKAGRNRKGAACFLCRRWWKGEKVWFLRNQEKYVIPENIFSFFLSVLLIILFTFFKKIESNQKCISHTKKPPSPISRKVSVLQNHQFFLFVVVSEHVLGESVLTRKYRKDTVQHSLILYGLGSNDHFMNRSGNNY